MMGTGSRPDSLSWSPYTVTLAQNNYNPGNTSLDVELLVDDGYSLELLVPGLGAGAEVAAGHHHGLQQQPVLQLIPVETLLRLDRGQLGSVRKEQSQICGEDAMLHVA